MISMRKKRLVTAFEEVIADAVAESQIAMMKEETTPELKKCTPELLADVLVGKYGKGFIRTRKLKKEGFDPESVNDEIAELNEFAKQLKALKKKFGGNWEAVLKVILP